MKKVRLKDLIELKTETISPKKNDNYFLYSLPSFDNNKNREYLKGGKIQSNKYKVPNRSILFNKLNVRFKRVWKIDNTDNNKICSTEFLPLVVDENKAYYNFCYYLLISENITNFLCNQNANTSGSHKRIDASMLLELEINLPPLETQQKIAKILSDIDDKIEVLHQINDNLAELAKTIYDYWFVQFDFPDENGKPYKSSGGKMVYNKVLKREIPEGWEVCTFSNFIKDIKNGDWGKEQEEGNYTEKVSCIRGADINGLNGNGELKSPIRYINKKNKCKILVENDFIIEISGGSPTQSTGRIALLTSNTFARFENNIICSNFCKAISLKDEKYTFFFLKEWERLYHNNILFSFEGKTSGIKNFLFEAFIHTYPIISPQKNIIEKYNFYNIKVDENKQKNLQQIHHLQSLRDWLLPMLMNGQISVK